MTHGPGPSARHMDQVRLRDTWTRSVCATYGPGPSARHMDQVHLLRHMDQVRLRDTWTRSMCYESILLITPLLIPTSLLN